MSIVRRLQALWFNWRISRVQRGVAPAEVELILGGPDEVEQSVIPVESSVGLQDCFVPKLAPGDPYLQWQYKRGDRHYYLWFARTQEGDGWLLAWKVSWPAIVDATLP